MFTDMVGYTTLTQASESRAMALLERHNAMLRPMFPRFHGKEVKTAGDSFLVEFDSALEALSCATEIQSSLHEYNLRAAPEEKIRLRIGVHLGDVIHRGGDVLGDAVNISSRIEPLAEPEGVCISRQVYDQVRNKFDLPLTSMGEKGLKNVDSPTEVFSVVMPWNTKTEQHGAPEPRRVAVLPFSSMSPDPNDEYFADGMTEELISTVSRIEGAEVISRTSVMQYKKASKPIREISKELDAGTVLEGSVRKSGNRLRVTVQMIDAGKDKHLWAESYDRNMDDVFAIQADIAGRVAEALRARMSRGTPKEAGLTDNMEAYTDFLQAKQLINEGSRKQLGEATTLLLAAVAKDPNFSRAYAELARATRFTGMYGDYEAEMKRGEGYAKKAIETGPDTAEAHAAMAAIDIALDRFEHAEVEIETAIRINPNLSDAHHILAEVTGAFGDLEKSLAHQRKAFALDPVSLYSGMILSMTLRVSGKVDEAFAVMDRMRGLYPNNTHVAQEYAGCYLQRRDFQKAREEIEGALKGEPGSAELRANLGLISAVEGKRDEALAALKSLDGEEGTIKYNAGLFINAVLGNLDGAFAALDYLADTHAWPFLVKTEPLLKVLHKDERFTDFCLKVRIPPGTAR